MGIRNSKLTGRAQEATVAEATTQEADERRKETEAAKQASAALSSGTLSEGALFRPPSVKHYSASGRKVEEGWLTKLKSNALKSDMQRWFVLHAGGELHYFEAADKKSQIGIILLHDLSRDSVVRRGDVILIKKARNHKGERKSFALLPAKTTAGVQWMHSLLTVVETISNAKVAVKPNTL